MSYRFDLHMRQQDFLIFSNILLRPPATSCVIRANRRYSHGDQRERNPCRDRRRYHRGTPIRCASTAAYLPTAAPCRVCTGNQSPETACGRSAVHRQRRACRPGCDRCSEILRAALDVCRDTAPQSDHLAIGWQIQGCELRPLFCLGHSGGAKPSAPD